LRRRPNFCGWLLHFRHVRNRNRRWKPHFL
jgi:hypothetical protein